MEGGRVWWIAPDYPRAKIGWRMIDEITAAVPGRSMRKMEQMILFPGGGWVQLKSAVNPDALRGEGLDLVVIDETADVQRTVWHDAVRPALSDRRGDALIIGTPKGRGNLFYELYLKGIHDAEWGSFQMPTWTNPFIPKSEIEQAKLDMPLRTFRQEYGAEFVSFEGRVYENFDPEGVMVFDHGLNMQDYHSRWGGIDFGFRNPTAIVVGGETGDGVVDIIDEHYERRLKPAEIVSIVMEMQAKYNVRQWWADPADPKQIQELYDAGINVEHAPRTTAGETSVVQHEIGMVSALLEQDPPGLRIFRPNCPNTVREHDIYRYPQVRDGNPTNEMPLKLDDHSCNAVHYMIHGLSEWYGWGDNHASLGDSRESAQHFG